MGKFKNEVIDKMNQEKEDFVVLQPGEVWEPRVTTETKPDKPNPKHCFHVWQSVVLFTSTVEECTKCGKLKEEK